MTSKQYAEETNRRLIQSAAWARSGAAAHWEAEARRLSADQFTPSISQRIYLARLYRRAFKEIEIADAQPPVTRDEPLSADGWSRRTLNGLCG